MIIKCSYCGEDCDKEVRRVNEAKKRGAKLYCSKECRSKSRSKKILCNCAHCNAEIEKTPSEIKKSKSGNVFCNKSCATSFNNTKYKSGKNNPNYKHGEGVDYAKIAFRNYEASCTICGHDSKPSLQAHHIDEDRKNNLVENLIILCANCHCEVHYGDLKITEEIINTRKAL